MRSPYRVLLVESDPDIGGEGRSLQALVAGLDRRRFALAVVCRPDTPIGKGVEAMGIDCHWPSSRLTLGRWFGGTPLWIWWLRRLIRRLGIDLVHVNEVGSFRWVSVAAGWARVPTICHHRMARSAEGLAWSFGLGRPAAMVFNSRALAEHTRSRLPGSLRDTHAVIVPNAVDTERFGPATSVASAKGELGWPTEVATVTVVSNLSPLKGQDVFIDAAALVARRYGGPVHFHLVGRDLTVDGRFAEALRRQVYRHGMTGQVRFDGAAEDVVPVLQASDVVVWPSRAESVCPRDTTTPVQSVGFPRAAIEASACGRPIVLSDAPGASEAAIVGETALVVPPGEPGAMAEAVVSLLDDPERRDAMGRAGRALAVDKFGLLEHGRRMGAIYDGVLSESRSHSRWLSSVLRGVAPGPVGRT